MSKKTKLLKPSCQLGYTSYQLDKILGSRRKEFNKWMSGQTMAVCDGREYDHKNKVYRPTGCGPHGAVTYASDVAWFFAGLPIID